MLIPDTFNLLAVTNKVLSRLLLQHLHEKKKTNTRLLPSFVFFNDKPTISVSILPHTIRHFQSVQSDRPAAIHVRHV